MQSNFGKKKEPACFCWDAMYDSQSYAQEEHFYYGLSMGMMLTQEVYERYGKRYFKTDK